MVSGSNICNVDSQSNGALKSKYKIVGICALVAVVLAVQGLIATKSSAQLQNFISCQSVSMGGFLFHNVVWRGGSYSRCWKTFAHLGEEDFESGLSYMVKRISREIGGSTEQERQIVEILVPALIKAKSIEDSFSIYRNELRKLLTTDTVDRKAIEQIRADKLAKIEALSRIWTIAFARVAETLTAEQRQQITGQFASRL